jgi:hypothetical protein
MFGPRLEADFEMPYKHSIAMRRALVPLPGDETTEPVMNPGSAARMAPDLSQPVRYPPTS